MQQLLELQQQSKELRTQLFMQLMWNSADHNRVTPLLAATCRKRSTTMKVLLEAGASKHSAKHFEKLITQPVTKQGENSKIFAKIGDDPDTLPDDWVMREAKPDTKL